LVLVHCGKVGAEIRGQPSALLVRRNIMAVVTKTQFKSTGEVLMC